VISLPNISDNILSNDAPQGAIDALERLLESYQGLLSRETLTGADQAVLMAVEVALKQVKGAA
jgi:hypothetical protein